MRVAISVFLPRDEDVLQFVRGLGARTVRYYLLLTALERFLEKDVGVAAAILRAPPPGRGGTQRLMRFRIDETQFPRVSAWVRLFRRGDRSRMFLALVRAIMDSSGTLQRTLPELPRATLAALAAKEPEEHIVMETADGGDIRPEDDVDDTGLPDPALQELISKFD